VARHEPGVVYVSTGTVRIGHQTYPLANIARLQVFRVRWTGQGRLRELGKPLLALGLGLAVLLVQQSRGSTSTATVATLALVGGLTWLIVTVARMKERLSLVIETAGGQTTAVSSKREESVYELNDAIVYAIDNPYHEPQIIRFGDLVFGDKVSGDKFQAQGGTYNLSNPRVPTP